MTYGELLQKLYELSPQQLQLDVTILTNGEFMPIADFMIVEESDVLDQGHPYLMESVNENS